MQINIRVSGVALLMVAVAIAAGGFFYDRHFSKPLDKTETTVDTPEVPVVMRTPGGVLEIATVKAYERFTRSNSKQFWGIDLGTTISQIQVTVTYRYHIEMAKEWPMTIKGKTCIVQAGQVKSALPVAFDTTTMRKYTTNGWARFNKGENLATLERVLTPELKTRAQSNRYLQLATDAGRKTVAEFVTNWLIKEQSWKRDPEYKVLVVFPRESLPLSAR
jgi:hypothetical protein